MTASCIGHGPQRRGDAQGSDRPRAARLNDGIDIATHVGGGLAKAHAAGIVHRDRSLMVTRDSTVKILDFGLARPAGSEGVTQTSTYDVILVCCADVLQLFHR